MSVGEGIQARARLMDEAEKMGAALVTSGVSRDRVVSYIFAQLCRIASDEARRRDAAWLEILNQVHKPHPQPEICMACVSILQREPRSASDPAEPEKRVCQDCAHPWSEHDELGRCLDCGGSDRHAAQPEPAIPDSRISNMSRLKEALAREGEIVEAQPEKTLLTAAKSLMKNNGGPISSLEQRQEFEALGQEVPSGDEDYVMVRTEDFLALCAAVVPGPTPEAICETCGRVLESNRVLSRVRQSPGPGSARLPRDGEGEPLVPSDEIQEEAGCSRGHPTLPTQQY